MTKTLIKQLAQNAKQRMTNSNYNEVNKNQNKIIEFPNLKVSKNQIEIKKLDTSHEDELLKRIYNILKNDYDTINPLSQIIDYEYFKNLNDEQKQKYVFDVAKLYNEVKEKYVFNKMINLN